jgi:threonine/homoserine/homoserine lactone efflux protein
LAAAGADGADLVLTLTNAWPFGRRTRLLTLAGIALNVMVQLYLAFDQEN